MEDEKLPTREARITSTQELGNKEITGSSKDKKLHESQRRLRGSTAITRAAKSTASATVLEPRHGAVHQAHRACGASHAFH